MKGPYPTCVKSFGICWAMGDPHYYTFDHHYFDFMGTCTYVVTKNCQQNDSLPVFEVLAKNENRGDISVSYVARVTVNIVDITISVESSEPGKVRVNLFYFFPKEKVSVIALDLVHFNTKHFRNLIQNLQQYCKHYLL